MNCFPIRVLRGNYKIVDDSGVGDNEYSKNELIHFFQLKKGRIDKNALK